MPALVPAHLFQYRAALEVAGRKPCQVFIDVPFDLTRRAEQVPVAEYLALARKRG